MIILIILIVSITLLVTYYFVNKYYTISEKEENKINELLENYSDKEMEYYNKLSSKEQEDILKIEEEVQNSNNNTSVIPQRFKILLANNSIANKRVIINKIKEYDDMSTYSSESDKLNNYINVVSEIPFGIYYKIEQNSISEYLHSVLQELNNKIYGHNDTKQQIMRILSQFMVNPNAKGYAIGIQGSMGVGKTKLIKDGVASVLKYPFAFVSLGGMSNSSYLKGHSYTYVGSRYGKIVEEIIKAKVMNPIFFFDELDKVSNTYDGDDIINTLIHLTDTTQNDSFTDNYLEEIKLDLSKSLMFFTFNDINMVNPILRDRMIIIKVDKYKVADKIELSKNFLIKEICKSYNINDTDIIIKDAEIEYIFENAFAKVGASA